MRLSALRLALFITVVLSIVNAPAFASEALKVEEIDHADLTDLLYGELNEEWERDLQVQTFTPTSSPTPTPSAPTSVDIETPTASPSPSVTSGALKMAPYAAHAAVGMAILVSMALMS